MLLSYSLFGFTYLSVHLFIMKQGDHKPGKPGELRDFHIHKHGQLREDSANSVQPRGNVLTDQTVSV